VGIAVGALTGSTDAAVTDLATAAVAG
jgi:hypothetical protein